MTERIIWSPDSLIGKTHPDTHEALMSVTRELVTHIGRKGVIHEVFDPMRGVAQLSDMLKGQSYSTVIDSTRWVGKALGYDAVTSFHVSRVRDPQTLFVKQYTVSPEAHIIKELAKDYDLTSPLLIDDVMYTGTTQRLLMELLGIKQADHAFFLATTGSLKQFETEGQRVYTAHVFTPPQEDCWHIADLFSNDTSGRNPNLLRSNAFPDAHIVDAEYTSGLLHTLQTIYKRTE